MRLSRIASHIVTQASRNKFSTVPEWATVDPFTLDPKKPHVVQNLLDGKWVTYSTKVPVTDPLNGGTFINVSTPETKTELNAFIESQKNVPNFGLHNPIKNVHRYNMYGDIFFRIAAEMRKPEVQDYLVKLTQRVMPKSWAQVTGEVVVTRKFFENFTGDNPRFFQQSFNVAGDHDGQTSTGYRWPFGNVCCITPFNFPIEIPALQLYGALLTGNRPLLKCDNKMSVVM
jgi:1-pyrroline-5-carboxylate dehydrogenase